MTDHTNVDDPAVAAVLAAAGAPAEGPMPGEAAALVAFRSAHHPRRSVLMSHLSEKAKLIAAAVFGGVVVISGAATAATGSLPLVGSSHAHPHPATSHGPSATDDDQGEDSTQSPTNETTPDTSAPDSGANNGKGSAVSQLAHELPKGHKGSAVCTLASDKHCQAGQHGKSGESHGQNDATTHGKTDPSTRGQSGLATHGKSGLATHGKPDLTTHGKSAEPHGHAASTS